MVFILTQSHVSCPAATSAIHSATDMTCRKSVDHHVTKGEYFMLYKLGALVVYGEDTECVRFALKVYLL